MKMRRSVERSKEDVMLEEANEEVERKERLACRPTQVLLSRLFTIH